MLPDSIKRDGSAHVRDHPKRLQCLRTDSAGEGNLSFLVLSVPCSKEKISKRAHVRTQKIIFEIFSSKVSNDFPRSEL